MKKLLLFASLAFCSRLAYAQATLPAPAGKIDIAHESDGAAKSDKPATLSPLDMYPRSQPAVVVDNIAIAHEHKGWRVMNASTAPVHFNLIKGDLIIRIDGKNAADTGPMQMASLFNQGNREAIHLFIERGTFRMETNLREIRSQDYEPLGTNPFKRVTPGFSAPDAEFKDIDGQPLTLEQFKDKWLLIAFEGTLCPPCLESLPELLSVVDRNHLSLLIITLNDKQNAVQRMKQDYDIHAPIAMMQSTSQLPIDFGITTNHWSGEIPGLVLIRPDGDVALIGVGGEEQDRIEKTIQCLIACKTDEISK